MNAANSISPPLCGLLSHGFLLWALVSCGAVASVDPVPGLSDGGGHFSVSLGDASAHAAGGFGQVSTERRGTGGGYGASIANGASADAGQARAPASSGLGGSQSVLAPSPNSAPGSSQSNNGDAGIGPSVGAVGTGTVGSGAGGSGAGGSPAVVTLVPTGGLGGNLANNPVGGSPSLGSGGAWAGTGGTASVPSGQAQQGGSGSAPTSSPSAGAGGAASSAGGSANSGATGGSSSGSANCGTTVAPATTPGTWKDSGWEDNCQYGRTTNGTVLSAQNCIIVDLACNRWRSAVIVTNRLASADRRVSAITKESDAARTSYSCSDTNITPSSTRMCVAPWRPFDPSGDVLPVADGEFTDLDPSAPANDKKVSLATVFYSPQ